MVELKENIIIDGNIGVLADNSPLIQKLYSNPCILIKDFEGLSEFRSSIANKIMVVKSKKDVSSIDNNDPWKSKEVDLNNNHIIVSLGLSKESVNIKEKSYYVSYKSGAYMRDCDYSAVIVPKMADSVIENIEESSENMIIEQRPMNDNFPIIEQRPINSNNLNFP